MQFYRATHSEGPDPVAKNVPFCIPEGPKSLQALPFSKLKKPRFEEHALKERVWRRFGPCRDAKLDVFCHWIRSLRMFPTVKVRLEGCEPHHQYYVFLDVIPVDDHRYRYMYNKSSWQTCGKAEPSPQSRLYLHPDSPHDGRGLDNNIITFEKAKLTNNADDSRVGHLVLNSMHKYQPRVHVVVRKNRSAPLDMNHPDFDIRKEEYKTFVFDETKFMAVTAYQNQLITKLKIEKNPFAKGFRDPNGRGNDFSDLFGSPCPAEPPNFLNVLRLAMMSSMFPQNGLLLPTMCPPTNEMAAQWQMSQNLNRFCLPIEEGKNLECKPSTSNPSTPTDNETNVSVDDVDDQSSIATVKTDATT
uniref:T-box domain-containing protein n=1 Tax=Bursaphelenchus xylophilus TaxID=6326 RepID=A0A1I7SRK8_BURXY